MVSRKYHGDTEEDEILLAENSYKTLHKLIKSGMWKMYCSRQFRIIRVEWSDEFRRMIGYQNETDFPNILESWSDLLHPEDYDRVMKEIDPVLTDTTGNTIYDEEYRLLTKNRGYRWFRATGDVSRRADGSPICFFGVFLDITDQKEHDALAKARDEALQKANESLRAMNMLHEAVGSGAWKNYFDEKGHLCGVEWSDAFRALLGYKDEEDFPNDKMAFFDRIHPEDMDAINEAYRTVIHDTTGKYIYDTEFRAKTKAGVYRWFRSTGRMIRRKDGTPETFYGMFMDIDDRKKTAAALVWRDMLSDIMTQSLDSVYVILNKKNRESVYVSPSIEHIFGIMKDVEHPLYAIQDLEKEIEHDFTVEELIALPEGKSIVQDCWITPVGNTGAKMYQKTVYHVVRGEMDLLIFEFTDHSHEQEIRKNIEDALEIARNANAAKSSFLSNMSHDIRTPMNVIVGLTNLMEHELDHPEKMREYIQKIQTSSNHLLGLINDVLDMSKIESGDTTLNIAKFSLLEQIREVEMLIRPQSAEKEQHLEVHMKDIRHDHLEGDDLRIRQILINILSNAVKYTQNGGHIRFDIAELEFNSESCAKFKFSVSDNGMGMKADFLEHIFEPFSRQENSVTNKIQGTGLGMAITRNLVDMMGGSIRVESTEGKGSTFEVVLELRMDQENMETVSVQQHMPAAEPDETICLKGLRFLCAEDNALNAEILQAMLETAGAKCVICTNGQEITERFKTAKPGEFDMILMDV